MALITDRVQSYIAVDTNTITIYDHPTTIYVQYQKNTLSKVIDWNKKQIRLNGLDNLTAGVVSLTLESKTRYRVLGADDLIAFIFPLNDTTTDYLTSSSINNSVIDNFYNLVTIFQAFGVVTVEGSYTLTPNSVLNSHLADMNAYTLKGNNSALAADPKDLTVVQVKNLLNYTASEIIQAEDLVTSMYATNSVTLGKLQQVVGPCLIGQEESLLGDITVLDAATVVSMFGLDSLSYDTIVDSDEDTYVKVGNAPSDPSADVITLHANGKDVGQITEMLVKFGDVGQVDNSTIYTIDDNVKKHEFEFGVNGLVSFSEETGLEGITGKLPNGNFGFDFASSSNPIQPSSFYLGVDRNNPTAFYGSVIGIQSSFYEYSEIYANVANYAFGDIFGADAGYLMSVTTDNIFQIRYPKISLPLVEDSAISENGGKYSEYALTFGDGGGGPGASGDTFLTKKKIRQNYWFNIELFGPNEDLVVTGNIKTLVLPVDFVVEDVVLTCSTPASGSAIEADIRAGGLSIFSTKPTIDSGEYSSVSASVSHVLNSNKTNLRGTLLYFYITAIGSVTPGKGLIVSVLGYRY